MKGISNKWYSGVIIVRLKIIQIIIQKIVDLGGLGKKEGVCVFDGVGRRVDTPMQTMWLYH